MLSQYYLSCPRACKNGCSLGLFIKAWKGQKILKPIQCSYLIRFFEIRTRCNGHCRFCLASVESDPRVDMSMPETLFEKVLHDLVDLKYTDRIAFHNNSQPLLIKEFADFVSKAREKLPNCFIQILTNGRPLNMKRVEMLITLGANRIPVNVYRKKATTLCRESYIKLKHYFLRRCLMTKRSKSLGLAMIGLPKARNLVLS